ncbi:MAG TPA: aldo/keto reductase [Acidimicrobiales bacterium]|nr:aldo/keto reductase [Acidimicrobiales bacterium]
MTDLPTATLGRTGLTVTKLGYGAMELRGPGGRRLGRDIDDATAAAVLNQVLDSGINFIDTSPDYGVVGGAHRPSSVGSTQRVLPRQQVWLCGQS